MPKRERKQPERLGTQPEPSPKKAKKVEKVSGGKNSPRKPGKTSLLRSSSPSKKSPTPASKAAARLKESKKEKTPNKVVKSKKDENEEIVIKEKVVVEKKVKVTKTKETKESTSSEPKSPEKEKSEPKVAASPKLPALPEKKSEEAGEVKAPKRSRKDNSKAKLPRATSSKKVKKVNPAHHREARKSSRKFFTQEEINALTEGVKEYGEGKWSKIKNANSEIFADRTSLDLKDKWRNIKKRPTTNKLAKDSPEGTKKRSRGAKDGDSDEPQSPKKAKKATDGEVPKRGAKRAKVEEKVVVETSEETLIEASV